MPLGGIGDQACADLLGGSGGGFTELAFVGSGNFLAGSGGGFTELAFVGSGNFLAGSGGGFTELAFVGSGNFLAGSGGGFTEFAFVGSANFLAGSRGGFTERDFVGCDSTGDGKGFAYAAWLGWEQLLTERETVKTASAMIAHIVNHDAPCRGDYASSLMIIAKGLMNRFLLKLG